MSIKISEPTVKEKIKNVQVPSNSYFNLEAIRWALCSKQVRETPLRSSELLVLISLARRSRNGFCWPSIQELCRETRLNRQTIEGRDKEKKGCISSLVRLGLIKIKRELGCRTTYELVENLW